MNTTNDDENPVPIQNTDAEQLTAFTERFKSLMEEALGLGISSVVLMCCTDPLQHEINRSFVRRGSFYEVLGLLEDYKHTMLTEE